MYGIAIKNASVVDAAEARIDTRGLVPVPSVTRCAERRLAAGTALVGGKQAWRSAA